LYYECYFDHDGLKYEVLRYITPDLAGFEAKKMAKEKPPVVGRGQE
jgi:hypothetical protein